MYCGSNNSHNTQTQISFKFKIGTIFETGNIYKNGIKIKNKVEQESPPAWTQEAYRPPCSKYSLCCPVLADPPPAGWPPRWLTPPPSGWPPRWLTPLPLVADPPGSWTWPPPLAGPDPPGWLTPPTPSGWPPHPWWLTPPVADPPVADPPRGQTDWWTDTCQNITFPSYSVRGR